MACLIFDLDGTLTDSKDCILKCIDLALAELGFGEIQYDRSLATQQDLRLTFRSLLQSQNLIENPDTTEKFVEVYRRIHDEVGEDIIILFQGVEESLERLASHFRLGVATTKCSPQAKRVLKKMRIDKFFHHIQGTDVGLRYKPEPDILLASLRVLNRSSQEGAYIGDSIHDMHAAKQAGLRQIGVAYGYGGAERLWQQKPDWMIKEFKELVDLIPDLKDRLCLSAA